MSAIAPDPSVQVHVGAAITSDGSIVSVTTSALLALPLPLTAMVTAEAVGAVASCVNANWLAAAVFVLPAPSVIAPTATSIVTASSASVGVNVYVQTVSELEPVPPPTEPPANVRVGAEATVSEVVTMTVYVPALVPYCPLVTPVTAIELTVGTVGS